MLTPNTSSLVWITVISLFFLVLVHPLWSIVDCAVTEEHSKAKKIVWIILMMFTWYLSSIFYGIFATKSRNLRIATLGSIVLVAVSMAILERSGAADASTSKPKQTKTSVMKKRGKAKAQKPK